MITFKRIVASARVFSQLHKASLNSFTSVPHVGLTQLNMYNFAFMSLFELNKTPAQLDPTFKRQTKLKGHIKFKKNSQIVSSKKNKKVL